MALKPVHFSGCLHSVLISTIGNIHVVIVCPQSEKAKGADIIAEVQKLAIEMEGTITGEHGIGLSLRDMLVEELGNDTIDLMRRVSTLICFVSLHD